MASQRDETARPTVLTSLVRRSRCSAYYLRRVTSVLPCQIECTFLRRAAVGSHSLESLERIHRSRVAPRKQRKKNGPRGATRVFANARRSGKRARTQSRQKKHCHSSSISFSLGKDAAGSSDRSENGIPFLVDAPVNGFRCCAQSFAVFVGARLSLVFFCDLAIASGIR